MNGTSRLSSNRLGRIRARGGDFVLLFHDTHHRAATSPGRDAGASSSTVRRRARLRHADRDSTAARLGKRVWTWHEAADTSVFYPRQRDRESGDLVWVGNWGRRGAQRRNPRVPDRPGRRARLSADVFGRPLSRIRVAELAGRHPLPRLARQPLVPEVFAQYRSRSMCRAGLTRGAAGIPTIRVFEALACGIPLVSAPWVGRGRLFPPDCFPDGRGRRAMQDAMRAVLADPQLAQSWPRTAWRRSAPPHLRPPRRRTLAIYSSLPLRAGHMYGKPSDAICLFRVEPGFRILERRGTYYRGLLRR
jgi:hypothetical protein